MKHMPYVRDYFEAVIVGPSSMIEHITLLIELYSQIREIGMMNKLSKYEFGEV